MGCVSDRTHKKISLAIRRAWAEGRMKGQGGGSLSTTIRTLENDLGTLKTLQVRYKL